jgi:nucleotide-binding universal stress UspA family protein
MKRILVALDGSDHALRALDLASDLAQKYGAELVLVHVVDSKPLSDAALELADVEYGQMLPPSMPQTILTDRAQLTQFIENRETRSASIKDVLGQRILDAASAHARQQGVVDVKSMLEHGDAAGAILRVAEDCGANLIVIGSRGRSDLQSLVLGSVSHKVNSMSPVNVITIR